MTPMEKTKLTDADEVVVCADCLRACCWHGEFMCDTARSANIKKMTVRDLRAGQYGEHEDYWQPGYGT